jgi:hypothetical protein
MAKFGSRVKYQYKDQTGPDQRVFRYLFDNIIVPWLESELEKDPTFLNVMWNKPEVALHDVLQKNYSTTGDRSRWTFWKYLDPDKPQNFSDLVKEEAMALLPTSPGEFTLNTDPNYGEGWKEALASGEDRTPKGTKFTGKVLGVIERTIGSRDYDELMEKREKALEKKKPEEEGI